jgi:uncharacterized repeat protein (TIGR01451 family)
MKPIRITHFVKLALWLSASALAHASAWAAGPLTSELTVQSVTRIEGDREQLQPARTVKPGELLQYTAVYTNAGRTPVRQVVATLPIPAGTVLAADTKLPEAAHASVDGKTFAPMPLMRKAKAADGRTVDVPVPLSEVRFLRWPEQQIAADGQYAVSARVRVTDATLASAR